MPFAEVNGQRIRFDDSGGSGSAVILSHGFLMDRESMRAPADCLFDREDITERLGEISCPAIVLHGTADASIEMERAEALCRGLPGCDQLVRIEGASHASNLTHPDEVNRPLLDFLRSL